MKKREIILNQNDSNSERPKSGWERKFWDEVTRALNHAPLKNLCYEFVTSGGTWMGVFEQGIVDRTNKSSLVAASSSCSQDVMEKVWPLVKKYWEEVKKENLGDCDFESSGRAPQTDAKNQAVRGEKAPSMSKLLECVFELKDKGKRGALDQEGAYEKMIEAVYARWKDFDWKAISEKVTVEINIDKQWGDWKVYSSACTTADVRR